MRDARRARAVLATMALLPAVALSGCGGSSAKHGEAAKSPQQIAADVVAATKHLHSFRLDGTVTDANGTMRITGTVAGPGRIALAERSGSDVVRVIALGSLIYMKTGRAYYAAQPNLTPAAVAKYADRWLELSTASYPSFSAGVTRTTNLSLQVRCWASRKRGLRVVGTASVGGHQAVIVTSDGSEPGGAPGKVYVAATGPAWPLRSVVTGPRKPGGSGACAESTTARASDITLSDINRPMTLAAPPSPLDLTR